MYQSADKPNISRQTRNDNDGLPHKENFENVSVLSLPVSICPESSLFTECLRVSERK